MSGKGAGETRQSWPANKPSGGSCSRTKRARVASEEITEFNVPEVTGRKSGAELTVAQAQPFITLQSLRAHRAARANLISADADFGPHTKFAAVREACGGVPIDRRRVDLTEEPPGSGFVSRDDAVRVRRTVMVNMIDCLLHPIDEAHVENVIVVFGKEILVSYRAQQKICGLRRGFQNCERELI